MSVLNGRYTSRKQESVTVFLIGMRINRVRAVHRWLPVLTAMYPMMRELESHKELGCLSMESFFRLRTTLLVQYWETPDDLMVYAKGPKHLKAWKTFHQRLKNNDAVGFYHETYVIKDGAFENVYINMPTMGIGQALGVEQIIRGTQSASDRLKR
ncbi:DUF4188 domain-containing protein [Macrococcus lamae]|uniref:DUF4188 domain-containing protein n=1 Tax=Macrococcus lamae TaxID=198484 RepID=A0A4V3BEU9_9STAP|nr:DUF4188 domain-containing protein [Macrococcus lamae]TDM07926.1 DUF4188 domain-containing protein [Macrococcus lamae]